MLYRVDPVLFISSSLVASSEGTGLLNRYPCPYWQPSLVRQASCSVVSMPSATTFKFSDLANPMIAVTTARALLSLGSLVTKLWSILILLIGKLVI